MTKGIKESKKARAVATPGPWQYDDTWGLIMAGSKEIAAIHAKAADDDSRLSTDEAKANARLIAAAPDLLAALIKAELALNDIISAADGGSPYTPKELKDEFIDDYNAVHAAIAKAEGGI